MQFSPFENRLQGFGVSDHPQCTEWRVCCFSLKSFALTFDSLPDGDANKRGAAPGLSGYCGRNEKKIELKLSPITSASTSLYLLTQNAPGGGTKESSTCNPRSFRTSLHVAQKSKQNLSRDSDCRIQLDFVIAPLHHTKRRVLHPNKPANVHIMHPP